jgi:hypothetical protein
MRSVAPWYGPERRTTQLTLAWDLLSRLPQVFTTLDRGVIDVPKSKSFPNGPAD